MRTCYQCKNQKILEDFRRDKSKSQGRAYICKSCCRTKGSEYRDSVKPNRRKYGKGRVYSTNNKEYVRNRYHSNPLFKLSRLMRNRLNMAIRNGQKAGSAISDLGCSILELRDYLESKFQPGMTWENHSREGWHIDHILPLASFDLSDREQLKKACHYTNLQPLWAKANLSKNDTIIRE